MTPARLAAGALVAVGVAQVGVRLWVEPRTEAWSLITADADGAVIWADLSVSNTGLLDQQLTTRLLVLPPGPGSIEHRAQWGPATLDADGVRAAPDGLVATADGWELRVGGEGLGARVRVTGAAPGCPPTIGAMRGMVEDRVDGRLVSGAGLVVRSRSDGHPVGTALYVIGQDIAAGIDPWADCPAWLRAGDDVWTGDAAEFTAARTTALTLGAWTLTFRGVGDAVAHDLWGHALPAERALAAAFGFHAPRHEARRATVRVTGPGLDRLAPALVLRRL